MEISRRLESGTSAYAPSREATLARLISGVLSPPVTGVTAIALSAAVVDTGAAWAWAGFYLAVVVLLPLAYVAWLVRTRQVTDFFLQMREQRVRPYLLALSCMAAAWLILIAGAGPALMIALLGAAILQALMLFVVNLRWKISAHTAAMAAFAILAVRLLGPSALPSVLLIPVVAWSRVRLGRHDPSQTVAGALLGGLVFTAGLYVFN